MPRPFKRRCVRGRPLSVVYKPAGIPACDLEWVTLSLDEFETIRLLDHQGCNQEEAAEKMNVSRPTITRIYASARKKIADAIVLGQAIRIDGGAVMESNQFGSGQAHRHRHRGGCGHSESETNQE